MITLADPSDLRAGSPVVDASGIIGRVYQVDDGQVLASHGSVPADGASWRVVLIDGTRPALRIDPATP